MTSEASMREQIAESWKRSAGYRVRRDSLELRPVEYDPEARFLRLAAPVLESLSEQVADAGISVTLADRDSTIVWRHSADRRSGSVLDNHFVAPGFNFNEDQVGTNGMGTALATERPAVVLAGEHFKDSLDVFCCASAPIRHPLTRHALGVLNLMCRADDYSKLMLPMVLRGVTDLERRIVDDSSAHERILFDRFLAEPRRRATPIFVVNDALFIANDEGGALDLDHRMVLDTVRAAHAQSVATVALPIGSVVMDATVVPIENGDLLIGAIVRLHRRTAHGGGSPRASASETDEDLSTSVRRKLDSGETPLLYGEAGTGKSTLLRQAFGLGGRCDPPESGDLYVHDCLDPLSDIDELIAAVQRGAGDVLITHVDALPSQVCSYLGTILRTPARQARFVGVTATCDNARSVEKIATPLAARAVRVAPVRERPGVIEALATSRAAQAPAGPRTLTPAALQRLRTHSWPGNFRELDAVLSSLVTQGGLSTISVHDLPELFWRADVTRERLTPIELGEAQVIQSTLAAVDWNKSAAASRLQMSRTSLYKKIRRYRIVPS
ncbi:sigma-54-dependent Fis family transcriptional regulator [Gordonia mangrovi]|uniref:sigma-54-dependent Fis family transcriptional regulator n=1 Tax=Gordonia mangrovi TaxID=2665643 RepID=UPI00136BEFC8|nr:helix-turn-helix domain-containing protein [Gordonia mangrovi]UVF80186.1 hypothetical protein NWF22_10330 [Gordonia mangrovi]